MTPAEHYEQAEALLTAAMDQGPLQMSDRTREFTVQMAQVHATLSLAVQP